MGEVIMINSTNLVHAIFGMKVIFVGLILAPLFFLRVGLLRSNRRTKPE
jgi:hypothetical protein